MLLELDQSLFIYINSVWTNPFFDNFFPFITDLHKTMGFKILALPVFFLLFFLKLQKRGVLVFLFLLLALGFSDVMANKLIKKTVQRLRPPETQGLEVVRRSPSGGFSFPSNHASNMFTMATYVSAFIPPARKTRSASHAPNHGATLPCFASETPISETK